MEATVSVLGNYSQSPCGGGSVAESSSNEREGNDDKSNKKRDLVVILCVVLGVMGIVCSVLVVLR